MYNYEKYIITNKIYQVVIKTTALNLTYTIPNIQEHQKNERISIATSWTQQSDYVGTSWLIQFEAV